MFKRVMCLCLALLMVLSMGVTAFAESGEPAAESAVPAEAGVAEPEAAEPEVTEPEAEELEVADPETASPETVTPEMSELEAPEVTEPEVTEPEAEEPEAAVIAETEQEQEQEQDQDKESDKEQDEEPDKEPEETPKPIVVVLVGEVEKAFLKGQWTSGDASGELTDGAQVPAGSEISLTLRGGYEAHASCSGWEPNEGSWHTMEGSEIVCRYELYASSTEALAGKILTITLSVSAEQPEVTEVAYDDPDGLILDKSLTRCLRGSSFELLVKDGTGLTVDGGEALSSGTAADGKSISYVISPFPDAEKITVRAAADKAAPVIVAVKYDDPDGRIMTGFYEKTDTVLSSGVVYLQVKPGSGVTADGGWAENLGDGSHFGFAGPEGGVVFRVHVNEGAKELTIRVKAASGLQLAVRGDAAKLTVKDSAGKAVAAGDALTAGEAYDFTVAEGYSVSSVETSFYARDEKGEQRYFLAMDTNGDGRIVLTVEEVRTVTLALSGEGLYTAGPGAAGDKNGIVKDADEEFVVYVQPDCKVTVKDNGAVLESAYASEANGMVYRIFRLLAQQPGTMTAVIEKDPAAETPMLIKVTYAGETEGAAEPTCFVVPGQQAELPVKSGYYIRSVTGAESRVGFSGYFVKADATAVTVTIGKYVAGAKLTVKDGVNKAQIISACRDGSVLDAGMNYIRLKPGYRISGFEGADLKEELAQTDGGRAYEFIPTAETVTVTIEEDPEPPKALKLVWLTIDDPDGVDYWTYDALAVRDGKFQFPEKAEITVVTEKDYTVTKVTNGEILEARSGSAQIVLTADSTVTIGRVREDGLPAPELLSAMNTENGISITWAPVRGAVMYRVCYMTENTGGKWKKLADTTQTSFLATGAVNGIKYTFTVRCVTADGSAFTSGYDEEGMSVVCERSETAQLATPKLKTVENTAKGISITWAPVTGAAMYRVCYKSAATKGQWKKLADTTQTSFLADQAKPEVEFTFTVRCVTTDGMTFVSDFDPEGLTILSAWHVVTPRLKTAENTPGGISLTWDAVEGAAMYRVCYKSAKTGWNWKKLADTTQTSYLASEAKSGVEFTFTVRCVTADGGAFTSGYDETGMTLVSAWRHGTPKLTAVNNTAGGISITWEPVEGAEMYRVCYKSVKTKNWKKLADTTQTSFLADQAHDGLEYTFTIRCVTADGSAFTSDFDPKGQTVVCKR